MNPDQMFVIYSIGGIIVFFGIYILAYYWYDAVCPGCRRRAPDFVWSYGHASKTYCEKCDPRRIKEVFGDNLRYLEHKEKKRALLHKRYTFWAR